MLFWLLPAVSFLFAWLNLSSKRARIIILFFSFIFGYSVYFQGGDILRYETSFNEVSNYSIKEFNYLVTNVYSPNKPEFYSSGTVTSQPDLYALTLQFIVSRFTENARWFFAIVSFLYTLVFLFFLNECMKHIPWKGYKIQKLFFLFLIFIVPFFVGVTGVRFWTSLFIFTTLLLKYNETGKIKYIIFSLFCILIHYAFIGATIFFIILFFVKKFKLKMGLPVLFAAGVFFFTSTNQSLKFINENFFIEDSSIEGRASSYTDVNIYEERSDRASLTNWYVQLQPLSVLLLCSCLVLFELLGIIKLKRTAYSEKLWTLVLLTYSITLITYNLGSIGRYKYVFFLTMFFYYTYSSGVGENYLRLRSFSYLITPIFTLYVLVSFRSGLYFVDPLLLTFTPFITFFIQSKISLSELIVGH